MDIQEEAAQAYRDDCEAKDRDAKYDKMQEERETVMSAFAKVQKSADELKEALESDPLEDVGILKKMLGKDYERYLEVQEARNRDHAKDSSV